MNSKNNKLISFWKLALLLTSVTCLLTPVNSWADTEPHARHKAMIKKTDTFKRSNQNYNLPNLTLVDKKGEKITVNELFDKDKIIMVNFIFTTCNTICPIMSGTFAQVDKELDKLDNKLELISISIDPEFDTPRELRRYSKVLNASENWKFITGSRDTIIQLQTALGIYRGSKMNHEPITLIRKANSDEWIRIDGFASAKALIQQVNYVNEGQNLAIRN